MLYILFIIVFLTLFFLNKYYNDSYETDLELENEEEDIEIYIQNIPQKNTIKNQKEDLIIYQCWKEILFIILLKITILIYRAYYYKYYS